MKKLLVIVGLGAAAWVALKRQLGGGPEEFAFTEVPPDGLAGQAAQPGGDGDR